MSVRAATEQSFVEKRVRADSRRAITHEAALEVLQATQAVPSRTQGRGDRAERANAHCLIQACNTMAIGRNTRGKRVAGQSDVHTDVGCKPYAMIADDEPAHEDWEPNECSHAWGDRRLTCRL